MVYDPNINAIGFVVFKDYLEVANPCRIPIAMLEDILKDLKKKKMVPGVAYNFGIIEIKLPKKLFKSIKFKNQKVKTKSH